MAGSRDANGNYSLPTGNPPTTNTTITVSWASATMGSLETEMTDSLSRSGKGAMLQPLKLASGTAGAPGVAFSSETSSGIYFNAASDVRVSIAGTDAMRWNGSGSLEVWRSAAWAVVPDLASTQTFTGDNTFSGSNSFTGSLTGNADTATALSPGASIGGVAYDGSAAIVPSTIQVTSSASATGNVAFFTSATGNLQPKTDSGLVYDASINKLSTTTFTGTFIQGAIGTATQPVLTFSTDTDTGFYNISANNLGITTAGTRRATFNSSGMVLENHHSVIGYESDNVTTRNLVQLNSSDNILAGNSANDITVFGLTCSVRDAGRDAGDVRIASYERKNGWTKGEYTVKQTVTAAATTSCDANTSNAFYVNVTTNITTLQLTNLSDGQTASILLRNNGTFTITNWGSAGNWKWANGVAPTFSSGAGKRDLVVVTLIDTFYVASILQDVS